MARKLGLVFDQGQTPTIACVNTATLAMGVDYSALVAAMQKYVDQYLAPVWACPCKLRIASKPGPKEWCLLFADDADAANALGYHELASGLPIGKVFVRTTLRAGEKVEVTASHELAEMLVDPAIQLGAIGPRNTWYALEVCDAVEAYDFLVDGIAMSDFQFPSWFESFRKTGERFDLLGLCKRPFQILAGGYMPIYRNGRWTQIFGSQKAAKQFGRTLHPRGEQRASQCQRARQREAWATVKRKS